jgi:hypothetical protein
LQLTAFSSFLINASFTGINKKIPYTDSLFYRIKVLKMPHFQAFSLAISLDFPFVLCIFTSEIN